MHDSLLWYSTPILTYSMHNTCKFPFIIIKGKVLESVSTGVIVETILRIFITDEESLFRNEIYISDYHWCINHLVDIIFLLKNIICGGSSFCILLYGHFLYCAWRFFPFYFEFTICLRSDEFMDEIFFQIKLEFSCFFSFHWLWISWIFSSSRSQGPMVLGIEKCKFDFIVFWRSNSKKKNTTRLQMRK